MASYNLRNDEVSVQPEGTYRNLEETDDKFQTEPKPRSKSMTFSLGMVVIILLVALIAITLAFGISLTSGSHQQSKKTKQPNTTISTSAELTPVPTFQYKTLDIGPRNITVKDYPKSCKDAYNMGVTMSGLVTLQPDFTTNPYEVYCDMKSVGGGWTLIASIHEDDLSGTCRPGDRWSSQYFGSNDDYENWLNEKTFGDVEAATSTDYKTSAYYNVNATDMMIWHVPNNVVLSEIDQEAFLKYYTNNGFLSKYGNNLQALYTKHAPIVRAYPKDISAELMTCMKSTNWTYSSRRYSWISTSSSRYNTPEKLSFSHKVYIQVNEGGFLQVTDSTPRNVFNQVDFSMQTKTLPFTALAFIDNTDKSIESFTMKIERTDPTSTYRTYLTSEYAAGFTIRYRFLCSDNVCHMIFYARGSDWNSISPHDYDLKGSNMSEYILNVTSPFRQILVGYTVFRRLYYRTYDSAIETVLRKVMVCFDKESKINLAHFPSINAPVKFLKGNMSEFNEGVTPGFIEFRQYDHLGYPYALCPGVRLTNSTSSKFYCVGSVSNLGHCSDFAAWDKLAEHRVVRPSSSNYTVVNDITSSLLLFVR